MFVNVFSFFGTPGIDDKRDGMRNWNRLQGTWGKRGDTGMYYYGYFPPTQSFYYDTKRTPNKWSKMQGT